MTPHTSHIQRLNRETVALHAVPREPEYDEEEEIEDTRVNGKFLRTIEYMNKQIKRRNHVLPTR